MADEILPLIQIPTEEMDRSVKAIDRKKKPAEKEKERNKRATKKKSSKTGGPLDFLITTNDWLEQVPTRIIAAFENFVKSGEGTAQSQVDIICAWLAWKVNIAVERKRQKLLKILYEQHKSTMGGRVMKTASAIKSFASDPLGALGALASALFAPIVAVFNWIKVLVTELLRLAENLARIASVLPPSPPEPHINYDKFKLKIGSISLSTITSDPSSLPSPEDMFPEPPKPFSKTSFSTSFETASANLKSTKMKYTLSEEDRNSLQGILKSELNSANSLTEGFEIF